LDFFGLKTNHLATQLSTCPSAVDALAFFFMIPAADEQDNAECDGAEADGDAAENGDDGEERQPGVDLVPFQGVNPATRAARFDILYPEPKMIRIKIVTILTYFLPIKDRSR
jgi:hypothetical protein